MVQIVVEANGPAVGTIGVWETRHGDQALYETGWMVLPAHQGRVIATAALALLIERGKSEPRFPSVHAFPPVTNGPSNALCRNAGFTLLGEADFSHQGRTLHCNRWGARDTGVIGVSTGKSLRSTSAID